MHDCIWCLDFVHTTPGKLQNRDFTLKTKQMSFVYTTPEATITGHFGFVFKQNSVAKSDDHGVYIVFKDVHFSKCFTSTGKRKAGVFKLLRFEERLPNAPFLWQIRCGPVGQTAEINRVRFRDILGMDGKSKLSFQIFPALCRRCLRRFKTPPTGITSDGLSCGKFSSFVFLLHPQWPYLIVWSHIVISYSSLI